MYESLIKLCIVLGFLTFSTHAQFCTPLVANITATELPDLPGEFETRVEINLNRAGNAENQEVLLLYDNGKRTEMVFTQKEGRFRLINYYGQNEQFIIKEIDKSCRVQKLNESTENSFFSFITDVNGLNAMSPNQIFHFNNDFPHVSLGSEYRRGIKVNHYQSCQNTTNANFLVDFYFKVPEHQASVMFDDRYKEILVAAIVEGYINKTIKFRNEYNFYEFRSRVERKTDLYVQPQGIYCAGQFYKVPYNNFSDTFSFVEETIREDKRYASSERIHYSKTFNAIRYDLSSLPLFNISEPVKVIHDFNSGVGYVYLKKTGKCMTYPIGTNDLDRNDFIISKDTLGVMKNPNEMFHLDDTYYPSGQRYERGILCNVFVSNRTDIKIYKDNSPYYVVELFMMQTQSNTDQSTDEVESVAPVSIRISSPTGELILVKQFYDFDTKLDLTAFDISQCFESKDKIMFAIRFDYATGINWENYDPLFNKKIKDAFYADTYSNLYMLNMSPLRIVPPKIEIHRSGIILYSAFTNYPRVLDHFKKTDKTSINVEKAKYALKVSEPKACAFECLNSSAYDFIEQKCMSFDFCTKPNGEFWCSFYNQSINTDTDVTVNPDADCDHYSKTVKGFDSADVNVAYRRLQEMVLKKSFNLNIVNDKKMYFFPGVGINIVKFEQGNADGTTSFFQQFTLFNKEIDFDKTIEDFKILPLKERNDVSIDECSRLCLQEPSFVCQTMSYSPSAKECKWSSLIEPLFNANLTNIGFLIDKEGTDLFYRNPVYNYLKLPFKVSSNTDYKVVEVETENKCAYLCNKEGNVACRSFNFCEKKENNLYRCLLSQTNIHSSSKDPSAVYTPLCTHYSKKALNDFQLLLKSQLIINSKKEESGYQTSLVNTTIETCAETCVFEDSYLCRSFNFNTETNSCYLYKENDKDRVFMDVQLLPNENSNHFSRTIYEENGVLKQVEAINFDASVVKYGGGAIFGIVIAIVIGGFIMGILMAFAYFKVTKKADFLPVMRFVNPNYEKQKDTA